MSARGLLLVIGSNLGRLMAAQGMSAEELASASRLDQASVEAIREGRREPSAEDLVRLAGALGVAVGELLDGGRWVADGEGGGEYRADTPAAD